MKQKTAIINFAVNLLQYKISVNTKSVILLLIFLISSSTAFTQIGILTDTPDASSALEIESTDKGVLIPRLTLTSNLSSPSPVTAPATGLLIFNSGANQPLGFYYWNGSSWVSTSFSTTNWSTTGNSSTTVANNFLGTIDSHHLAIKTNNTERMRIESDGQIVIGATSPTDDADLFTVQGNATQYSAINAYSPSGYGVYTQAGSIGYYGQVNYNQGYGLWVENQDADGYGAMITGSSSGAFTLNNHSSGISSHGDDGIFCIGHATNGIGIIAGGNNTGTLSTISVGAGGSFTGYHGAYAKAINSSSGVGIVGVGNNENTYHTNSDGSGGAFTGYHGSFSYSTNYNDGTGVIGVGNDGSYYLMTDGSGGAFTGRLTGVAGWSTNSGGYGVYGQATGGGYGVFASGNMGASGTKSFVIDHPLDPENKILIHYSVESPEVLNMYRGNANLNNNGEVIVSLPEYFTSINIDFSYTLTAVGSPAPNIYIKTEINSKGEFTIAGGNAQQKISWVVYAQRNDEHMKQTDGSRKVVVEKKQSQKGKFINPKLYNQPESKGIYYIRDKNYEPQKGYKTESIDVDEIKKPKNKTK